MDDTNASATENLIDSRALELPPLLRNRFDRLRGRRIAELLRSHGPPDPRGIQLFSNDYLSLANHPNVVRAMLTATAENTDSLWMASVFFGDDSPQRQLERRLAAHLGTGDCVLVNAGLTEPDLDRIAHACRLACGQQRSEVRVSANQSV